jgi:hypothetical protein
MQMLSFINLICSSLCVGLYYCAIYHTDGKTFSGDTVTKATGAVFLIIPVYLLISLLTICFSIYSCLKSRSSWRTGLGKTGAAALLLLNFTSLLILLAPWVIHIPPPSG